MWSNMCVGPERGGRIESMANRGTIVVTGAPRAGRWTAYPRWPMAVPNTVPASTEHRRKVDTAPRLITADAALLLVERWKTELNVLRRRSPTSDAVRMLADCVDELSAAITAGHDVTVHLTVVEANAVSHIPISTLRWLCKHRADLIGARKREGVWYIDRALFERYMSSPDGHAATPREDPRQARRSDKVIPLVREARADSSAGVP